MMEEVNKKECPKCKSRDVFDRGDRAGEVQEYTPVKSIVEPDQSIYECRNCGEVFIYLNGSKK